jgi:hypothetical protein
MGYSCRTWTWFDPARAANREWLSKKKSTHTLVDNATLIHAGWAASHATYPWGPHAISQKGTLMRMVWTLIREGSQKRTLRAMLKDPRAARGFRSTGQLEKAIGADRSTTERLLLAVGARKSDVAEEWTLKPL